MDNPLAFPECANPGMILTRNEFENRAEDARLIEDLLDREDLDIYEFIEECIERANARRTPQNLHLWVGSLHFHMIALVPAPLAHSINTLRSCYRMHEKALVDLQQAITETLKVGTRP